GARRQGPDPLRAHPRRGAEAHRLGARGRRLARRRAAPAVAPRRSRRPGRDVRRHRAGLGARRPHRADAARVRHRVAAHAHRAARGARRHAVDAAHAAARALPPARGAAHHPRAGGGAAHEGPEMRKWPALLVLLAACATDSHLRRTEEEGERMRLDLAETYVKKGAYTAAIPLLTHEL